MAHVTLDGLTARIKTLEDFAAYVLEETVNWLGQCDSAQHDLQHLSNLEARDDLTQRLAQSKLLITNLESEARAKIQLSSVQRGHKRSLVKMEPEVEEENSVSIGLNGDHAPFEMSTHNDADEMGLTSPLKPEMKTIGTQTDKVPSFKGHWITTSITPTTNCSTSVLNSVSSNSSVQTSSSGPKILVVHKVAPPKPVNDNSVSMTNFKPSFAIKPRSPRVKLAASNQQQQQSEKSTTCNSAKRERAVVLCPRCSKSMGNSWNLHRHMRAKHPKAFVAFSKSSSSPSYSASKSKEKKTSPKSSTSVTNQLDLLNMSSETTQTADSPRPDEDLDEPESISTPLTSRLIGSLGPASRDQISSKLAELSPLMNQLWKHPELVVSSPSEDGDDDNRWIRSNTSLPVGTDSIDQSRSTRAGMRLRDRGQVGTRSARFDPSQYNMVASSRVKKDKLNCPCCPKVLKTKWNLAQHIGFRHPEYQKEV